MKKILLLTTAFIVTMGAFAQTKADSTIKVNAEKHDFGKIVQNSPVTFSFELKNVTDKPVVIENTWASCGCTTPEKIVDPIMPGKSASLKVQYNAAAAGPFTKDVYIKIAGIEQPRTVQITGEVLTQEAFDALKKNKPETKENNQPTAKPATGMQAAPKPKLTKD
jgi:hypothetical protein